MKYDILIIGAGPGGYEMAAEAAHRGLNVAIVERGELGGTCLNRGCIPTKALCRNAEVLNLLHDAEAFGVSISGMEVDYAKAVERKDAVVTQLRDGIGMLLNNPQITVMQGEAKLIDAHTVSVGGENVEAQNIVIATGSAPKALPIEGAEFAMTSDEILAMTTLPKSLCVIGGGVIGMEFAGLFSAFGSKVTIVEMASEILPGIDAEIAALLRAEYEKRGVAFHLGARVLELQPQMVKFADENGENELAAQQILLCVGRRPNVQNLGLEPLCLERFRNGLKVDEQMRTSHPRIYAAGDVTGFSMLAHTAVREAEVAVNHILGIPDAMTYDAVPGVVYTNPEVAGVGVTEAALQSAGAVYSVKKLPMTYSGRFVAENEGGNGLCKLIFDAENRLKGAHLIGNPASELVATAALAIEQKLTVDVLAKLIFPHPSVGEILKETLLS